MEGTTQRSGQLQSDAELLPDPDPLWQIVEAGSYSMLFQHQGDGRLAGWEMLCGYPYEAFELSPSLPDLNWKLRGSGTFNHHYPYLIWQNELTGQIGAWKMGGYGTSRRRDRLDGQLFDAIRSAGHELAHRRDSGLQLRRPVGSSLAAPDQWTDRSIGT